MPQTRIARSLLALGAAALLASPAVAGAQGAATLPLTPGAAECVVDAPRTVEEIEALADAADAAGTPEVDLISTGTPATNQPSSSAPAGEDTVAAVTATLVAYYGCVNAGDLLSAAALETDLFIGQQLASGLSLSGQDLEDGSSIFDLLASEPVALAGDDRFTITDVRDVLTLRTGDVRATVEHTITGGATVTDTVSFSPSEGGTGYLISGAVLDPATGTTTPAA